MLINLTKENEFNKLFKSGRKVYFLFVSLWDDKSSYLLKRLMNCEEDVYVINSFDMPHSFSAFQVARTPTLVGIDFVKDNYRRVVFNSHFITAILHELGVETVPINTEVIV